MIKLVGAIIMFFTLPIQLICASELEQDIQRLEKKFAEVELEIVNSIDALPKRPLAILRSVSVSGNVADFGEQWNPTDNYSDDDYLVRHIFSGVSDQVTAVLYQSGGYRGPTVFLILMDIESKSYCRYMLRTEFRLTLSMELVQSLFNDPTALKPSCLISTVEKY